MHSIHFLDIAAVGIRAALFLSGPPSLIPRKCPVSQAFAAAWALMQNQTHKRSAKKEGKEKDGADPRPKKKKNKQ